VPQKGHTQLYFVFSVSSFQICSCIYKEQTVISEQFVTAVRAMVTTLQLSLADSRTQLHDSAKRYTIIPIRVKYRSINVKVKSKKSKAVPLHAMEALGGRGGIAPIHSRPRH
jgi:hypothetical protein